MTIRIRLLLLLTLAAAGTANAQGDSIIHIPGGSHISNVQFARNGAYLLAREDDTVKIWGIPSGKQMGVPIVLSSTKGYASLLPGDTTILTVAYGSDSVFNIWDWRTGKLLKSVSLFRPVSEAVATPDGQTLAILVTFPQLQYELWNVSTGTYREALLRGLYTGLALDSAGRYGIVSADGVPSRVNTANHTVDTFHVESGYITRSYLSRDGYRAGFVRSNRTPIIFDVASGDSIFSLDIRMSDSADLTKGIRTYVTLGLSDDHRYIATITARTNEPVRLEIWDGMDGHHIAEVGSDPQIRLGTLKISPRGDYVAIYTLNTGMYIWPLHVSASSVSAVAGISGEMHWYPNPAMSDVSLKWSQSSIRPGKLRIVNTIGQIVHTATWESEDQGLSCMKIPTAFWPSGQYFGVIEAGGQYWVSSFIVRH